MSIFTAKRETAGEMLLEVPVSLIAPNPAQPRRVFDDRALRELAASIREVGLIQPIVVRRTERGYELVAGERRLRAVMLNGEKLIRCVVLPSEDRASDPALAAAVENVQREDLHFFEEAECYAELLERGGLSREQLASKLGKSQSYLANKLRLTRFSPQLREKIVSAGLSERHARALLALENEETIAAAIVRIAEGALSVKETERLIKRISEEEKTKRTANRPKLIRIFRDYRLFVNTVNAACDQLRESGLKVAVEQTELENGVDISIRVTQE